MISDEKIRAALAEVARFYDRRKVGDVGHLGFRRSTDLGKLSMCLEWMIGKGLLAPGRSRFLDMGCGDGRVNVLFSYLVEVSVGVELDEWTLDDYFPLREELDRVLRSRDISPPPDNILLFCGDSTDEALHEDIREKTAFAFSDFDLFYTYLTMQEEFAALISRKAKQGAVFMVYGLERIMPGLEGFELLTPGQSLEGILALYRKK
ncbi:MAG: hypothetical protein JW821_10800 [Deltaproteobacteria bacterium]|nr:hypothetical protein [Deltaproteobacteria bacterium]